MVRGSLSRGWAVSLTLVPSFLPPPLCAVDDASGQWRGRPTTDRPTGRRSSPPNTGTHEGKPGERASLQFLDRGADSFDSRSPKRRGASHCGRAMKRCKMSGFWVAATVHMQSVPPSVRPFVRRRRRRHHDRRHQDTHSVDF